MLETFNYIIEFLLRGENTSDIISEIAYTSDVNKHPKYKLVIVKSDFFDDAIYGTEKSLPKLPLNNFEGIPILFGDAKIEKKGETTVLHADIIASTYFLISRYEEYVRREIRDVHGRFPGKESLPYQAGFISYPLVDEYGKLLRKLLRETGFDIQEPKPQIKKIYLTHDVDCIAHYRNTKSVVGALLRGNSQFKTALKTYFTGIQHDPWFTFAWILEQNNSLKKGCTESIFFVKPGGGKRQEDKPHSDVYGKDFQYLFQLLKDNNASIGLHASYEAGIHPSLIPAEKAKLEKAIKSPVYYNRHHFLDTREPEDMQALVEAGITHDFTMGYADVAGFRLGTSRPVLWINPATKQLTSLTLHPLTVMDGTLNEQRYMGLNEEEAYNYVQKLIDETKKHNGELCLLWHNTTLGKDGKYYHRNLYANIIDYLKTII
ncbi:hypothetical protein D0T49_02220 [Paludibacter sp. 221]|uniref:polysaccharide deacetylase family protein n=1 Tax=Paludibacter sp. 221 TaxID=2302939 RepID=UPI0013D7BBBC|nr:polysaccharide deacetylase family protein [Paludibacter sp. 221]NDV45866.1 hypothetical protein [Paludibacter sp. 221]